MINAFIKIRLKQILRGLKGMGVIRLTILFGLFLLLCLALLQALGDEKTANYVIVGQLFLIGTIQISRGDIKFLKSRIPNYKYILNFEYLLISLPTLISCIFYNQLILCLLLLGGIPLLVFLDYKLPKHSLNTKFQRLIPNVNYEWKAGSRRLMYFLLPLWLIGLLTSFFIESVPIVISILGITVLNFYEKCESSQMIIAFEKSSKQFLWSKIKSQSLMFTIIVIPLIISFLIFHMGYWYLPIIIYFIFITLHNYFLLIKYAFYDPNTKSVSLQTIGAIGIFGAFIPWLLPVVWVLSVYFYSKSITKLNVYLNDFN